MIDKLLLHIYISNAPTIILGILLLLVLWFVVGVVFASKMRTVSAVVSVLVVALIFYATVFSRSGEAYELYFAPFSSFSRAVGHKELYRSMLMNVLLFLPLGLTMPYVFDCSAKKRIVSTIITGFLLSASCEFIQYIFELGVVETDDVICNTVGTAIGCCTYLLFVLLGKLIEKRKEGQN